MERLTPKEWVVDQANFDEFKRRMETDQAFKDEFDWLLFFMENEKDPYAKLEAYWTHNDWIHKNGHVDVKDAMWDYIEGRR